MKNLKYKFIAAALLLGCAITLVQASKEKSESFGNAELMRQNLNEPNSVNPAKNNIQKYEKDGIMLGTNIHTEEDLANTYNRNYIK